MLQLTTVVDAVADDLAANVVLPEHREWRYVEPVLYRPDVGPLLSVYVGGEKLKVVTTTENYEDRARLYVAWYEPRLKGRETGGMGDPAMAKEALETAEKIIARLKTYADAVPGVSAQTEGTVIETEAGIIEGTATWAFRATVQVRSWN